MRVSESVKPISYLKAHAAEIISNIGKNQQTLVITQNGEAKAVLQDIKSYEQTQETLLLLKLLAVSEAHLKQGRVKPLQTAFADIRRKIKEKQK